VVICALAGVALAASPALAATSTASVESPRDPALPASRDISRVDSTFDDESGTWWITITRYGETEGPDWAAINAILFAAPAAGAACGRAGGRLDRPAPRDDGSRQHGRRRIN
jgi:hypothetical protein